MVVVVVGRGGGVCVCAGRVDLGCARGRRKSACVAVNAHRHRFRRRRASSCFIMRTRASLYFFRPRGRDSRERENAQEDRGIECRGEGKQRVKERQ